MTPPAKSPPAKSPAGQPAPTASEEPVWARHLPPGLRWQDLDVTREVCLPAAWSARWREDSSKPVLHDTETGWMTAAELEETTAAIAGRLHRAGLSAGDRLAMNVGTSVKMVAAHVAALRMGLVVVPVNTAYREREVAHIVRTARPSVAVVDDKARMRWFEQVSQTPMLVVGPDIDLPDGPAPKLDAMAPSDLAIIGFTSGTTGAPKGAMLSQANALACAESLRIAWRWLPDDRLVLALPLFHLHGLGVGLHGTLLSGSSAVLHTDFDVDGVLDAAVDQQATLFFGVPTMYARFARSGRVRELNRFRMCASGSAALPAALHHRLRERSGQVVLERYGMTETLITISNPYDGERRAGTIGFPLPAVEMRLSDGEDARDAREILIKGPTVFSGYLGDPQSTSESVVDGWMRTGDLATVDSDGYVRLVGRRTELIITGGVNVYPREVEDVLRSHPAVADAAVVGKSSDEWGEVVTAFVVTDGNLHPDELMAFAAGELAPYKRPRAVHLVDALPRNALGKVLKDELVASL